MASMDDQACEHRIERLSLIVAINPVMTALLSAIWLKEAIRGRQVTGFAVSLAGVLIIVSGGSWKTFRNFSFNPGDLILVAAPVTWAVYSVMEKRVLDWCSPLAATAWASLFGTLLLVPCALIEQSAGASSGSLSVRGRI
jgi:drug/metabolite transporter (DMT)-like permease